MKFEHVGFDLHEQTNRHTNMLITILCTSPGGEVISTSGIKQNTVYNENRVKKLYNYKNYTSMSAKT